VLVKRKGNNPSTARWGLKEAWNKVASRRIEIGYEAVLVGRAGMRQRSPDPSMACGCKSGGCATKAVELTPGDLCRVPSGD